MLKEYKQPGSDEAVDLIEGVKDHRLLTVITALLWGLEVKLDHLTFRLAENTSGGVLPVMLLGEDNNIVMGASDLTFEAMSNMVAGMTDKEYEMLKFSLSASRTLTEFNQPTNRNDVPAGTR